MLKYLKDAVIAFGSRLFATLFSVFSWVIERFVQIAFFLRERLLAFLSLRFVGGVSLTSFVLLPSISHAAIDVSAAIATFADVNTAIPVVGAAFLLALGILAAWKLVRGAFA